MAYAKQSYAKKSYTPYNNYNSYSKVSKTPIKKINYTQNQLDCFELLNNTLATKGNTTIKWEAVAGSGKTTSIIHSLDYCSNINKQTKAIIVCYNKSIMEEIKAKVDAIEFKTGVVPEVNNLHKIAFPLIKNFFKYHLDCDPKDANDASKYYTLYAYKNSEALKLYVNQNQWVLEGNTDFVIDSQMTKLFDLMRQYDKEFSIYDAEQLVKQFELNLSSMQVNIVVNTLINEYPEDEPKAHYKNNFYQEYSFQSNGKWINTKKKISKGYQYMYDYIDMIYLCIKYPHMMNFPKYDLVFADEVQDFSVLFHQFISLLTNNNTKTVLVGDPDQSIYGFSGGNREVFMDVASDATKYLSDNFRCGKKIIEFVKTQFPDKNINAHESNPEGEVLDVTLEEMKSFLSKPENSNTLILNYKSFPLVKVYTQFLVAGIKCKFYGQDITKSITTLIKDAEEHYKKEDSLSILTLGGLQAYSKIKQNMYFGMIKKVNPNTPLEMLQNDKQLEEMKETEELINLIIKEFQLTNIKDFQDKIIDMFGDADKQENINKIDGITFLTSHKSKGLEAENVFILQKDDFIPKGYMDSPVASYMITQMSCLEYVSYTRAMRKLFFVTDCNIIKEYGNKKDK